VAARGGELRTLLSLILIAATAAGADTGSWQNLAMLEAGQNVEVATKAGTAKGEYVRFDAGAIKVRDKRGEHAVKQTDVSRVVLPGRSGGFGLGVVRGGVAGVMGGAALGGRLAKEGGGAFAGSKPAVTGATAVAGVAIGAAIGAAVRHPRVVYRKP